MVDIDPKEMQEIRFLIGHLSEAEID